MIKKLILTVALLMPGLAYGQTQTPSVPFSDQVVPATSDPPPVPAPAAAAGFTSLALNADFSQPSYANLANWLDGCGGPTSGYHWAYRYYYLASPSAPCGQIDLETDPTISKQVLHGQYLASDSSGHTYLGISWPDNYNIYNSPFPNYLPMGYYVEVTFRTTSTSLSQGSFNADVANFYQVPAGSGYANLFEKDFLENQSATEDGNNTWIVGDSGIEWCSGTRCGGINGAGLTDAVRANTTQYHTYGALFTTDTTSQIWKCAYLDGVKQACAGDTSLHNPSDLTAHDGVALFIWGGGNPPQLTNNVDVYIQGIRIWACPGSFGTSTQCTTLVTN